MRKLIVAILSSFLLSCGQGTLPSNPVLAGVFGSPSGDSLEIHWYSLEGADRYEVKGVDENGKYEILYSGQDTFAILSERYPYYTALAYAPSDIRESDTVKVVPLEGSFLLRSYGSGFESALCYLTDSMDVCDPENEENQAFILLLLDSLRFISPSVDSAKFGSKRVLYALGGSDKAPHPPSGYSDTFLVQVGDTVAVWLDLGVADTFDLSDNVLRVVVDSVYTGDGSRDSIKVKLNVRYQTIRRLLWY